MAVKDISVEEKIRVAALRAAELLIENGLSDWKLKITRKRRALAETWHDEKTICFSRYFMIVADKEQFDGVTLHEVAHALLGAGYGHGKEFVEMCTKISPTDLYAGHSTNVGISLYRATCPNCGYEGSLNKVKKFYCGMCYQDKPTLFNIKKNEIKVGAW